MLTCFDCGAEVRRGRVNCMEGHLFVSLHRQSRDVRVSLEKGDVAVFIFGHDSGWTLCFVITVVTLRHAAKHQSKVVIFPEASLAPNLKM